MAYDGRDIECMAGMTQVQYQGERSSLPWEGSVFSSSYRWAWIWTHFNVLWSRRKAGGRGMNQSGQDRTRYRAEQGPSEGTIKSGKVT